MVYINEKVYHFSLTTIMSKTKRKISVRNKEYTNIKFEYIGEQRIQISSAKEICATVWSVGWQSGQVGSSAQSRSGGRSGASSNSRIGADRGSSCSAGSIGGGVAMNTLLGA